MFQFVTHLCKLVVRNIHIKTNSASNEFNIIHHAYNMIAMQQKKMLKNFYTHYNAKLKVIGSGAPGTAACVYLLTDHKNYLFNCGEGIQRLSQEHHCKLSKLSNIFITRMVWENVGGLAGLLLTAQTNGLNEVCIHCPEELNTFIDTIKLFVYLPNLKITYVPIDEHNVYKDDTMKVSYIRITKSSKNDEESSSNLIDETQYRKNVNGKRIIDEKMQKNETVVEKKIKSMPTVICYVCEIHPRRGKLMVQKCIELGIPPGPLFQRLKNGSNITKEDGTVVFSKDVCEADTPKATFIVAECPTEEYLNSFLNHPAFLKYQQTNENDRVICIFHFTPEKIFIDQRYQDWINKFSSKTEHIILNYENTCMGSAAVYKNQYLLNMLHPEIFPLLNANYFEQNEETKSNRIHRARTGQTLILRPVPQIMTISEIYKPAQTYIDEVSNISNFLDVLKELKINLQKKVTELNLNNTLDYPRIVMLGTGCSVPNKVRNTSAVLIRIDKDRSILLDCGEGTLGQIIRFYGISESNNILRTIKTIYVSHIHADHHLGLIGLLLQRNRITDEPLHLLLPKSMIPWLNFCNYQFQCIVQRHILVNNSELYLNHHTLSKQAETLLYDKLNIKEINTTYVAHCNLSYGIAIIFKDNKKIVYSGDTMFCKNLINLGQDCDLLIHEATMENGLEKLAKRKFHSTTSEAINAGKFMNAKFILLTHFSQRYSKIPFLPDKEINVGLAYDNMELKFPQLQLLPLFYPCIKIMFNEYNKVINE